MLFNVVGKALHHQIECPLLTTLAIGEHCPIDPLCEMGCCRYGVLDSRCTGLGLGAQCTPAGVQPHNLDAHSMQIIHSGKEHECIFGTVGLGASLLWCRLAPSRLSAGASAVSWCKGRFPRAPGPDVRACTGGCPGCVRGIVGAVEQWRTHRSRLTPGHNSGHR